MALRLTEANSERLQRTTSLLDMDSAYTICGWIRLASIGSSNRTIVNLQNGDGHASYMDSLIVVDGTLTVDGVIHAAYDPQAGTTLSADTWYHVALVRSGTSAIHAYLNGALDAERTGNDISGRAPTAYINVGSYAPTGSQFIDARFFGWKAWSRALTAAELMREMRTAAPASRASLHAWWPFLAANRANDYSGNGRDWTETNTPTDEDPPNVAFDVGVPFVEIAVAGGASYTLSAESGSFTLTGNAAALEVARMLTAASGSFALTGQDASLIYGLRLEAESGTFTLTGGDASFLLTRVLIAESGTFTLTGQDVTLTYAQAAYEIDAEPAEFVFTGGDATLTWVGASPHAVAYFWRRTL